VLQAAQVRAEGTAALVCSMGGVGGQGGQAEVNAEAQDAARAARYGRLVKENAELLQEHEVRVARGCGLLVCFQFQLKRTWVHFTVHQALAAQVYKRQMDLERATARGRYAAACVRGFFDKIRILIFFCYACAVSVT